MQPGQAVDILNDRVRHVGKLNTAIADWLQVRGTFCARSAAAETVRRRDDGWKNSTRRGCDGSRGSTWKMSILGRYGHWSHWRIGLMEGQHFLGPMDDHDRCGGHYGRLALCARFED